MKNVLKKITTILVLMMLLINSSLLLVISSAIDAIESIIDETKVNVLQEIKLEKYVNYSVEDNKGTLVQFNLKTGIEYEEGEEYAPLGSTGILLNLPKIDDEYPQSVEVVGISTKATNGSDIAKDFAFVYDEQSGEVKIAVVNQRDEDGNIYSENIENARDEYSVICYYGVNCYDEEETKRNLEISGFVQANIAKENTTSKKIEINENYEVAENMAGLISIEIATTEIYNGYINSNKQNRTNYRTEYIENLKINISHKEISDEMTISTEHGFIDTEDNVLVTEDIIYKSTKINKNDVLNILGEDGYLEILNAYGDVLVTLNKDTEVDDNGIYEVVYENDLNKIIVKTSKAVALGTILLQNTKEIKESVINTEINGIKTIDVIKCINNIEIQNENNIVIEDEAENEIENENEVEEIQIVQKEIYSFTSENIIEIKNSQTKIDLSIDKSEWTNNVQNSVQFNVKLIANSIECSLFENPVIEIKLPGEVEKVILGESYLLYAQGLVIDNVKIIEENDSKIIRAELSGIQNDYYNNDLVDGAELVIPATIMVKKDISSTNAKVQLKGINGEEQKELEFDVKMVSVVQIAEEVEGNEQVATIDDETEPEEDYELNLSSEITVTLGENVLGNRQEVHEHEYIRYNIKLKNDSDYKIENINVVGDVPEGTVYVYNYFGEYSYDEDDKYRTIEDESVKEYRETISIDAREEKELYYWVRVNLLEDGQTEKNIESSVIVDVDGMIIDEYSISNVVKIAEMELKVNASESDANDSIWIYAVELKNNTENQMTNIVVNMDFPEGIRFKEVIYHLNGVTGYTVTETSYGVQIDVPVLKANETKDMWILMKVTRLEDTEIDFEAQVYASAKGDNTDTYYSNLNKEIIHTFGIEVVQTSEKEGQELEYDEEIEYDFVIKNISSDELYFLYNQLVIMNFADTNLVPISAEYEHYRINGETNEYEISAGTLDISKKYVEDGVDPSTVPDLYLVLGMTKGGDIKLKLKFKAGEVQEKTEVSNCVKIQYNVDGTHIVTSNIIKNVILPRVVEEPDEPDAPDTPDIPNEPDEPDTPDTPEEPDGPSAPTDKPTDDKKYSISGFAWFDLNKNGKYDDSESKLKNITAKLFNSTTNEIVKDNKGNNLTIKTDANGEYKFDNLSVGEYLVLFEYDSDNYSVTTYKAGLIAENKNSDVITKEVNIDGLEKMVAISDTLIIKDSNLAYINMGLIRNEKFDLSLNKSIVKMVVSYDGSHKEYNYDESKLVKVEIPSKKISGAKIEIQYQIEITNEGDVNGYVDEIVDYIPDGFSFDSALNKGWTQTNSGLLKNTTYAGIVIKPGESKIVKLNLTRTLTNDSIGTLVNVAEILKSNSINGDSDIDSISGNKVSSEDDYSKAELIIAVKTGAIVYTGIIILILIILAILKLFLDKKIINIKKLKMFSIVLLFGMALLIGNNVPAYTDSISQFGEEETNNTTSSLSLPSAEEMNALFESYAVECAEGQGPVMCCYERLYHDPSGADWSSEVETAEGCIYDGTTELHLHYFRSHGYVHHGGMHNLGDLYCVYGGDMAIAPEAWAYSYDSIVSVSASWLGWGEMSGAIAEITDQSSASYLPYNSEYFKVGPFNFKSNIEEINVSISPSGCTVEGSVASGVDFYVIVPKNVLSVTVTAEASSKASQEYFVDGYWTEQWLCDEGGQVLNKDEYGNCVGYVEVDTYDSASATASIPVGTLRIEKEDWDTGDLLTGYTVTVQENYFYYDETFTITSNPFEISDLPSGCTYSVTETDAPPGYNLDLQLDEHTSDSATVPENGTATATLYDRMFCDLIIQKVDAETGQPYLEDLTFEDVEFLICYETPGNYIRNLHYDSNGLAEFDTTTNEGNAQIFRTSSDGRTVTLYNMPANCEYYVVEKNIPITMQQYYDTREGYVAVDNIVSNWQGQVTEVQVKNMQVRIDLEGYVWEDIAKNKETGRDDIYNKEEITGSYDDDELIDGMTVRLKKDGVVIAETQTDENGAYKFLAKGMYNGNQYTIDIDTLGDYLVEFEYNGLRYENVVYKKGSDDSINSKAKEITDYRSEFNNNFYNIQKGETGTGVQLKYSTADNKSSLVKNTGYTVESLGDSVDPKDSAKMLADTETSGYAITRSDGGTKAIKNINFGIYEREQPDLAIITDLDQLELNINGYSHIYKGNKRNNYIDNPNLDGFSVNIKYGNEYKNMSYIRPIYDSYIAYTKNDPDNEKKLKVFVTYKTVVKNESSSLVSKVGLRNYKDSNLSYIAGASYYIDDLGNPVGMNWYPEGNSMKTDGLINKNINPSESMTVYLKYELSTEIIVRLAEEINIELDKNVTEISTYSTWDGNQKPYGGIDKDSAPDNATYNATDTYEDDTDAAPALTIKRKETNKEILGLVFEDSTSSNLLTGQERKGSTKYEDGESGVNNAYVQLINRTEDNNEPVAKLYDLDASGGLIVKDAQILTDADGKYNFKGLIPGEYYIKYTYGYFKPDGTNDFVQSKVRNDIEVTTQNYKSTIIDVGKFKTLLENNVKNTDGYNNIKNNYENADPKIDALWYWYQNSDNDTYSSAVDDYTIREAINNRLQDIKYDIKTKYDNKEDDENNHYMKAYTGFMDFAIEDYREQETDMDYSDDSGVYPIYFGIVERPRQSVRIDKEVSHVHIALANGQVLITGDPRNDEIDYVTYPDGGGTLKIEVDNEIIEGATLDLKYEITVTNNSELDYNHSKYYYYGDKTGLTAVTMKFDAIVDYVDEKLSLTYSMEDVADGIVDYTNTLGDGSRWYLVNQLSAGVHKIADYAISPDVYNAIKNRRNMVVRMLDKVLAPGDSTSTMTLVAKKLLTELSDTDQIFDNYAEILGVSNAVGRFYGEIDSGTGNWKVDTPGNFNVYDIENTTEADNNYYGRPGKRSARTTIVPPTGVETIIIYSAVAVICLSLLAGGIILIKRKVLD